MSFRNHTRWGLALIVLGLLCWRFPLFHFVSVGSSGTAAQSSVSTAFDAKVSALRVWEQELLPAAAKAVELRQLIPLLARDPRQAAALHAKSSGLGAAYYFVRGTGRVVSREGSFLRIEVAGAEPQLIALRIGPVFGNTLRDGCALLDVNQFPGLQEFNALAAELNALAEARVIPLLREKAVVGAVVSFSGCAEAPETVSADKPLLNIIPVEGSVP